MGTSFCWWEYSNRLLERVGIALRFDDYSSPQRTKQSTFAPCNLTADQFGDFNLVSEKFTALSSILFSKSGSQEGITSLFKFLLQILHTGQIHRVLQCCLEKFRLCFYDPSFTSTHYWKHDACLISIERERINIYLADAHEIHSPKVG
jgi:hypothetical protein